MAGILLHFFIQNTLRFKIRSVLATVHAISMKWFVRREEEVSVGRGVRIAGFPLLVYVLGSLAFDWG